jgi:hypothetical protein
MNFRQLVPSLSRRALATGFLMLAAGLQQPVHASGVDLSAIDGRARESRLG